MTTDTITLGGSQAAAACGLDRWKSPVRLYLEIRGEIAPEEPGESAAWGQRLQPLITEAVEEHGYMTMPAPWHHEEEPLRSEEFPWMHAHPDGFVSVGSETLRETSRPGGHRPESLATQQAEGQMPTATTDPHPAGQSAGAALGFRGILEVKTAGLWRQGEFTDGACPPAYVLQATHNMIVTKLDWALVAVLIGGQRLELRRLEYDPGLAAMLLALEEDFVRSVERGEPPAPDGSKDAGDLLKRLYPHAGGEPLILTGDDMEIVKRAKRLKKEIKESEAQLAEAEQLLKARLGDAPLGLWEGSPALRWPEVASHRLDAASLKAELPDVYDAYYRETSYRRFTIS